MVTPPDNNSNYMQAAAEKAISDLQKQADSAQEAAKIAKASATRAETLAGRWRKLTVGIFVLVLVIAGLGAWSYAGLRQQAINSCNIGNDRAAGTVAAINELVILLEGPHPTAAVKVKAAAYDNFVASHNKVRSCSRAYSFFP